MNNNLSLFNKRFPSLYKNILPFANNFTPEKIPGLELFTARNGSITAKYNGINLHSTYNPEKESEKLAKVDTIIQAETLVFYGFSLGYLPNICATLYPKKNIVLIENDPFWLLLAFSVMDWTPVLHQNSCVFFMQAPTQIIIGVLEQLGLNTCTHIAPDSQIAHNKQYFSSIQELVTRNRKKQDINEATLEKFSNLWLRNLCTNIKEELGKHGGITKYKDCIKQTPDIPALLLAAGPSLERVLPYLSDLYERCIIICVDTALQACLSTGVQPHFIVLVDPQYWNSRHLDRLKAPESILITESAAYPSVFRFQCKEIVLCSSMFPLGQYIENYTGKNGTLAAGGSVASSAWDFARYIGCQTIFTAGLDLGFPQKKTHSKGSTFEERTLRQANRLQNTETKNARSLYSINSCIKEDYNKNTILSDERMSMYAWWFESKLVQFPRIQTKTLTPESLYIPGIEKSSVEQALMLTPKKTKILSILKSIQEETRQSCLDRQKKIDTALSDIKSSLQQLKIFTKNAKKICNDNLEKIQNSDGKNITNKTIKETFEQLTSIDKHIKESTVAPLAALVFPTSKKLDKIYAEARKDTICTTSTNYLNSYIGILQQSEVMYCEIERTINLHFDLLFSQVS
ncbi:MAG: hypothetical protein BKP49_00770 [Treponema sp. CETP13]|nr:MAG: hypothetical protein BKP49_00770 [Treponema sp. CETP13]